MHETMKNLLKIFILSCAVSSAVEPNAGQYRETRISVNDKHYIWSRQKILSVFEWKNGIPEKQKKFISGAHFRVTIKSGVKMLFKFDGFDILVDEKGNIYKNNLLIDFKLFINATVDVSKIELGKTPIWEIPSSVIRKNGRR
jgi:hypothetical protein